MAAICEALDDIGADIADIVVVFRKQGDVGADDTDTM